MIKVGQRKHAKYWGSFTVEKVAMLSKPVKLKSEVVGRVLFNPTLVKIVWDKNFSHEFWFPYWITTYGKEKYGQFAPMMTEDNLLDLLQEAIRQDFFTEIFLRQLSKTISVRLKRK